MDLTPFVKNEGEKPLDRMVPDGGLWDPDRACQAYIIALGVNDVLNQRQPIGTTADVNLEDYTKNADTFTGWYARIIQKVKEIQPKARIFLVSIPHEINEERNHLISEHAEALRNLAEMFEFTYVIDLERYAPANDEEYRRNFHMASHLNAAGYLVTAKMMISYIDYIIRNNPEDFAQVGFIGKAVHHKDYKW